jgi:hypothetical protein
MLPACPCHHSVKCALVPYCRDFSYRLQFTAEWQTLTHPAHCLCCSCLQVPDTIGPSTLIGLVAGTAQRGSNVVTLAGGAERKLSPGTWITLTQVRRVTHVRPKCDHWCRAGHHSFSGSSYDHQTRLGIMNDIGSTEAIGTGGRLGKQALPINHGHARMWGH